MTIAEVARMTGLSRAAARRCLHTLQQLGYIASDGRQFALRPKVLSLGFAAVATMPLATTVQPFLEHVNSQLCESASLSVLEDDEIFVIARATARRNNMKMAAVGCHMPLNGTALGRVLLAHLPSTQRDALFARMPRTSYTEHTIADPDTLLRILDQVRAQGYAMVDREIETDMLAVAVPIRNPRDEIVGAINVAIEDGRMSASELEGKALPVLREAARDITTALRS